ncbi:MAG: VCBS domain-containing protein [Planctomycetales bacterium]|nr:VCBS domain-containing protein [Planctomycetales bacterium]
MLFETCEPRRLLTAATVVQHDFREDDFSLSGTYSYLYQETEYEDRIDAGTFNSTDGHVIWTSPTDGSGFVRATAIGNGSDRVRFGGGWIGCSTYTVREDGRWNFTLDAAAKQFRGTSTPVFSTEYTSYRDLTGGFCPAPDPPWPRLFSGEGDGTFDPATNQVSVAYSQQGSFSIDINFPPAPVLYAENQATDVAVEFVLPDVTTLLPDDWEPVSYTANAPEPVVDANGGQFDVSAAIVGKPMTPGNDVTQPVATMDLYWVADKDDSQIAPVMLSAGSDALGVYWNSRDVVARISQLSDKPEWANYVKVQLAFGNSNDASATNNVIYVKADSFIAGDSQSGPFPANTAISGNQATLLSSTDAADSNVFVSGYNPVSMLGMDVSVSDSDGHFSYDPTQAIEFQELGAGETLTDVIDFQATKYGALFDTAKHTIVIQGVNDPPIAQDDEEFANDSTDATIDPTWNDTDIDNNDFLRVKSVPAMSARGAKLTIQGGEILYQPQFSAELSAMVENEELVDTFTYEVTDRFGATDTATVTVTVFGSNSPPSALPVPDQFFRQNSGPYTVDLQLSDPDSDVAAINVFAPTSNPSLFESVDIQGSGANRQLVFTLAADAFGRSEIYLSAYDAEGGYVEMPFTVTVGLVDDLDLDGVLDTVEDAAPNGGDMNNDGTPDRQQPHVISLPTAEGDEYWNAVTTEGSIFQQVSVIPSPSPSGGAASAQFPLGLLSYQLNMVDYPESATVSISHSGSANLNTYYQYDMAQGEPWQRFMSGTGVGASVFADHMAVLIKDGAPIDQDGATDGVVQIVSAPGFVDNPWRNPVRREDVNNDSQVSPIDALLVINAINLDSARPLGDMPTGSTSIPGYIDVSGDNSLSPIDVAIVVTFLNTRPLGEGESADSESVNSANPTFATASPALEVAGNPETLIVLPLVRSVLNKSSASEVKSSAHTNDIGSSAASRSLVDRTRTFSHALGETFESRRRVLMANWREALTQVFSEWHESCPTQ